MNKNIIYFAKKVGLYPESRNIPYWKGHGRHWRVNDKNQFQMSDTDFDKWANSVQSSTTCPNNLKQFRTIVKEMLSGMYSL